MDLTAQVIEAINAWMLHLATQLLGPALASADLLLFQTPAFAELPAVAETWALVRDIADSLFVLALLGAGLLLMAGAGDARYAAKLLIPRLVLAGLASNMSLALCGALIRLNDALVVGLLGPTPGPTLLGVIGEKVASGAATDQLIGALVAIASAVLALLLVALAIGRDLVLLVATVVAPLALATYALPQLEELARSWWRIYAAVLFVQVIQALLLALGAALIAHTEWLGGPASALTAGLVLVTVLYLLFQLPFAAFRFAVGRELGPAIALRLAAGRVHA